MIINLENLGSRGLLFNGLIINKSYIFKDDFL